MNSEKCRFEIIASAAASLVVVILSLSGCSANKEAIQFSDEHMETLGARAEAPAPSPKKAEKQKLNKQDLFKVEVAVYSYLLQRHFWDDGGYSGIFLQGEDDEVDVLIGKFPGHVPPIKPSYHADLQPNRTPIDKDTGKPAMILSVDAGDPNVDDSVDAIGRWYAGGAVTGFYSFILKKSGDDWTIDSVK
jgi:hypothetical protein